MAIVKQYHKDTGVTYVYESKSYWDPEKKQARSDRKCIGKIDPDTGEMIPTGKRGRKKSVSNPAGMVTDDAVVSKLNRQLDKAKEDIISLKAQNADLSEKVKALTKENQHLTSAVQKIWSLSGDALA